MTMFGRFCAWASALDGVRADAVARVESATPREIRPRLILMLVLRPNCVSDDPCDVAPCLAARSEVRQELSARWLEVRAARCHGHLRKMSQTIIILRNNLRPLRNLQNRTGFALRFVFVLHPIPF